MMNHSTLYNTSGNNSNSTSVPRPTIASELKLLKEGMGLENGSPLKQDIGKKVADQFLHNNNLANFMWN